MSLADELLADLEDNDHDELEEIIESKESVVAEEKFKNGAMEVDTSVISSIRELAKLRDSETLKNVMNQIDNYSGKLRKAEDIIGPVEADPEYQLIVEANNIAADVDNEIGNRI